MFKISLKFFLTSELFVDSQNIANYLHVDNKYASSLHNNSRRVSILITIGD